jgi:hypothetical protein
MPRPVDLPRIRRALSALDRIAAEHPEIRHRGQPWANDMSQLQETIMTPGKERIAKYRAKQHEKGMKAVNVFLTPAAQAALNRVQSERPDTTMGDVISDALLEFVTSNKPAIPPQDRDTAIYALHGEGLTLTQIAARLAKMGLLTANGTPLHRKTITLVLSYRGLKPN